MPNKVKQVNIYIAKRDREEQFLNCLHYLNEANKNNKYMVTVIVAEDVDKLSYRSISFPNIEVKFLEFISTGLFNKSKLLNACIECGDKLDYEWFQICDLDMLYSPDYFDMVGSLIGNGADYIVCLGWKLLEGSDYLVQKHLPFNVILETNLKSEFIDGPSQIAVTRKGHNIIKKYFPESLYNAEFLGWGGEDSVLSSKSRILEIRGKLNKVKLRKIWIHQWHVEKKGEGNPHYAENLALYNKLNAEIMSKNIC